MRIGLIAIYVGDQDQAERFYTETLGFQVKTGAAYGAERWLSVVSPEEPDGLELTLHLADEAARAFQATRRQIGRPVFALHTDDCQSEADRLKAKGVEFLKERSDQTDFSAPIYRCLSCRVHRAPCHGWCLHPCRSEPQQDL